MNQQEINEKFVQACSEGNLNLVKEYLTSNIYNPKAKIYYNKNQGLLNACENGHLEIVQYLLASSELTRHANIHDQHGKALELACRKGHLEIVRYLISSNVAFKPLSVTSNNSACFVAACEGGQLEIVKYLLTSPELEKHVKINDSNSLGFRKAAEKDHVELVKYLLLSPELSEHANIRCTGKNNYKWLCRNKNNKTLTYLLSSPELKEHVDIKKWGNKILEYASFNKNVELIKILMHNPNLEVNFSISGESNNNFNTLCGGGAYDFVVYLLTSNEVKDKPIISDNIPLYNALAGANMSEALNETNSHNLKLAQYLIENTSITQYIDEKFYIDIVRYYYMKPVRNFNSEGLINFLLDNKVFDVENNIIVLGKILKNQDNKTLEKLLYERNMTFNVAMKSSLENCEDEEYSKSVLKKFANRELYIKLQANAQEKIVKNKSKL